jgi:C-terminal processing protease CtpA/Prc
VGDILIAINGKLAFNLKLEDINKILHGKTGSPVQLRIERYVINRIFRCKLDHIFKKNEPSN